MWLLRLGVRVIHGASVPSRKRKGRRSGFIGHHWWQRFFRVACFAICKVPSCGSTEWRVILQPRAIRMRHWTWRYLGAGTSRSGHVRFREQLPGAGVQSDGRAAEECKRRGWILQFRGREWRISKAFRGERVGVRPTVEEKPCGKCGSGRQCLGAIDQRADAEHWREMVRTTDTRGTGRGSRVGEERRLRSLRSLRPFLPHSVMSMCYPCVRTPVTLDSGPNSKGGEGVR